MSSNKITVVSASYSRGFILCTHHIHFRNQLLWHILPITYVTASISPLESSLVCPHLSAFLSNSFFRAWPITHIPLYTVTLRVIKLNLNSISPESLERPEEVCLVCPLSLPLLQGWRWLREGRKSRVAALWEILAQHGAGGGHSTGSWRKKGRSHLCAIANMIWCQKKKHLFFPKHFANINSWDQVAAEQLLICCALQITTASKVTREASICIVVIPQVFIEHLPRAGYWRKKSRQDTQDLCSHMLSH